MLAARLASVRRVQTLAPRFVRHYAEYNEGATAKSKEFSKREQAAENKFAKDHEKEQLKKIRAQMEAKKAELESLQKEHDALAEDVKKN